VSLAAAGFGLAAAGGGRGIVTTANIDFAMVPEVSNEAPGGVRLPASGVGALGIRVGCFRMSRECVTASLARADVADLPGKRYPLGSGSVFASGGRETGIGHADLAENSR
jgi:hypothetical protein